MMVPVTGSPEPPDDLIMSLALVAVISMVSRARRMVSWSAAAPLARSCSTTRTCTWTILKEWSSFMSRTSSASPRSYTRRVPPWSAEPRPGARPAAALKACCASFSFAPAFFAAFWMLNTTNDASRSQNSAMTATTQPTTSFWLAAKMTATRKAVIRTRRPGPLMRNNPPRAGLEEDLELPRDCMQLLSQTQRGAPERFHRRRTPAGPQPTAGQPPAGQPTVGHPSAKQLLQEQAPEPAGGQHQSEHDHHQVVADVDGRGRREGAGADLAQQLHAVPQGHGLDEPLDELRVDAERVERGAEQEHGQHDEVDPVHLLEGLHEARQAHAEAGEAEGDQHRRGDHQQRPGSGDESHQPHHGREAGGVEQAAQQCQEDLPHRHIE